MQLSKEAIEEYKQIYKKKTGKELSDQGAYEQASSLLKFFELVYRPIPENQIKEFKKICKRRR